MTVGELIALLHSQDPDLRVVVDGYESGFSDVAPNRVYPVRIVLGVGVSYGGDHSAERDYYGNVRSFDPERERVTALVISRQDQDEG